MSSPPHPQTGTEPAFSTRIATRWRDLDVFNHVNNSNFLTYLEETRILWFQSLDMEWVNDAFAPLLASVHMDYRQPIPYPGDVLVQLFITRTGSSSMTIGHRITDAEGKVLYADGYVVMVWVDLATQRPMPLPEHIRALGNPGPRSN